MPLIARAAPVECESPRSYLLRISGTNFLPTPAFLRQALGISNSFFSRPEECEQLINGIGTGKAPTGFAYAPLATNPSLLQFGTNFIPRVLLNITGPRICPECIRSNGIAPRLWDLKPYAACHVHGVLLVDICPKCDRRLIWDRRDLLRCKCNADLDIRPQPAHPDLIAVSAMMAAAAQSSPTSGKGDQLSLGELSLVTWFFACGPTRTGFLTSANFTANQAASVVLEAAQVPLGWPRSLSQWLENNRIEQSESLGVSGDFGYLPQRIKMTFGKVGYDFVAKEFANYLNNHWNGPEVKPWSPLHRPNEDRIRLGHAAAKLGMRTAQVISHIQAGDLKGALRWKTRRYFGWVSLCSTEKFIAERSTRFDVPNAAKYLGLTEVQTRKLFRKNIIEDDLPDKLTYQILKKDIDEFSAKLASLSQPKPAHVHNNDCISLGNLAGHKSWNFIKNLEAIFAGRLPIYQSTKKKNLVSDFLLPWEHLERVAGGVVNSANDHEGNLSVRESAKFLDINMPMVAAIARAGLLKPAASIGNRYMSFAVAELRRFQETYAFSWQVHVPDVPGRGRHTCAITYYLRRRGVTPALSPNGRIKVYAVWRKADLAFIEGISYRLKKGGRNGADPHSLG